MKNYTSLRAKQSNPDSLCGWTAVRLRASAAARQALPTASRHDNGFSLLELSIVLVVIGLVIGSGISLGVAQIEAAREAQTRQKLSVIEQALLNFRRTNDRLPCPSRSTTVVTDVNDYGREIDEDGIGTGNCTGTGSGNDMRHGAVPVKTLGLPLEYMYDGWGRQIRYFVFRSYSVTKTFQSTSLMTNGTGFRVETQSNDGSTITLARQSVPDIYGAAYALISYGKNGHGGYLKNATPKNTGSSSSIELQNCQCDSSGNPQDLGDTIYQTSITQSSSAINTDDITVFKYAWQLRGYDE